MTAKQPFEHLATTPMQVMVLVAKNRQKEVDLPPKVHQEMSEAGIRLLKRCLKKDPTLRPNATEILFTLNQEFEQRCDSEYESSFCESNSASHDGPSMFFPQGNYPASMAGSTIHSHVHTHPHAMGSPTQTEFDGHEPQHHPSMFHSMGGDDSGGDYHSDENRSKNTPQQRRGGGGNTSRRNPGSSPIGLRKSRSKTDVQTAYSEYSQSTPQQFSTYAAQHPVPLSLSDPSPTASPMQDPQNMSMHSGVFRAGSTRDDSQSVSGSHTTSMYYATGYVILGKEEFRCCAILKFYFGGVFFCIFLGAAVDKKFVERWFFSSFFSYTKISQRGFFEPSLNP